MVGFVFFPPSPRHLSLGTARDLGQQARRRAIKVALTVDADDATLSNIVEALQPDILQLHGKETVARLRDIKQKFGLEVMKAIAVEGTADLALLPGYAAVADRILFDARPPKGATRPGGLGAAFDWHVLEHLDLKLPFMVSGGLNADNVAQALRDLVQMQAALAEGDLSERIVSEYRGDFATLKNNANATAERIGQTIAEIKRAAQEVTSASAEISGSTTDLSQRTEEQAASLEETSASMEEIAAR
jgi:phosphoribosylanthranilate isomerase